MKTILMNYLILLIVSLSLASGAASAEDKMPPAPRATPQMRGADAVTACPHKGTEAMFNVDKSLSKGPVAQRVTLLCLAEAVKNLQARVKELETAKAK